MRICSLFFILFMAGAAAAMPYMLLCDDALPLPPDSAVYAFSSGDTIEGNVRVNGPIAISGSPQFYSNVITTQPDFACAPGCDPVFHGSAPTFNAPALVVPTDFSELRDCATVSGNFFSQPGKSYRLRFQDGTVQVFIWDTGTLFDSTDTFPVAISGRTCLFFDAPLEIYGRVHGQVTVGCSQTISLIDNIFYMCSSLRPTGGYVWDQAHDFSCTDLLGIVSEGDIKIANTWGNGRANSSGEGLGQTNRDSTDIVIMASLWAAGKITFEQQNDVDSGYVCDCTPDVRGQLWLHGCMVEPHFTALRRSNNGGTGYWLKLKYDQRLRRLTPPALPTLDEDSVGVEDTLDFGGVPVGVAVWDTVHVRVAYYATLGTATTIAPFSALHVPPYTGQRFVVPVRMLATHTGAFAADLQIVTSAGVFHTALRGRGLPGLAPRKLRLEVSPNPFNLSTSLRYALDEPTTVTVTLCDVLGRTAREVHCGPLEAGEHSLTLDASGLASGVYFLRLQAGSQSLTRKLMLLK